MNHNMHEQQPLRQTIYYGTFIHTPTPTTLSVLEKTSIGVSSTGTIIFIEPLSPTDAASKHSWSTYTTTRTPSSTSFFFPGLIDTHTHASQYPNVGLFGSSTLLSWLETYTFPLESSYTSLARARTVYRRVVARTLSHGTTCAAYYATIHVPSTNLLADICHSRGQRALIGRVCMDRMSPEHYRDESPATALQHTKDVTAHIRALDPEGALIRPIVTPRFAPSCTSACLSTLSSYAESEDLWTQTHISENSSEIELVRSLFPGSPNYAGVYDCFDLLTPKTILAHAVHLTPEEVRLIAARGSKVSHCPVSNSALTSGAAEVRTLLDAGIDVGLGTDMSGGYSASVLEVARQAMLVSRVVALRDGERGRDGEKAKLGVEEVLYLATKGGARCVGLEGVVGGFEVGMEWDAQLVSLEKVDAGSFVDGAESERFGDEQGGYDDDVLDQTAGPVDIFGWESWPDLVAKWLYGGDDRNVLKVWVRGRLVHVLGGGALRERVEND